MISAPEPAQEETCLSASSPTQADLALLSQSLPRVPWPLHFPPPPLSLTPSASPFFRTELAVNGLWVSGEPLQRPQTLSTPCGLVQRTAGQTSFCCDICQQGDLPVGWATLHGCHEEYLRSVVSRAWSRAAAPENLDRPPKVSGR